MFVTITFGYKQRKFFTTDCLTAYMMDQIWLRCNKEMIKKLDDTSSKFKSIMDKISKNIDPLERQIKDLERQINDEKVKREMEAKAQAEAGEEDPVIRFLDFCDFY